MTDLRRFGFIGPVLLWGAMLVAGALTPGYSHLGQYLSELGAHQAPHAAIVNFAGVIPFGVSIALLSIAGYWAHNTRWLTALGFGLLLTAGLLFVVAGIYRADPVLDFSNLSEEATIHVLAGLGVFIFGFAAMEVVGISLIRQNPPYAVLSLGLAGVCLSAFAALYVLGFESAYRGVLQRVFLLALSAWMVLTSHMLERGEAG